MPSKPEHMLPHHIGGEVEKAQAAYQKAEAEGETQAEKSALKSSLGREAREQALDEAPDLKQDIRLRAVEAFQRLVREAQICGRQPSTPLTPESGSWPRSSSPARSKR